MDVTSNTMDNMFEKLIAHRINKSSIAVRLLVPFPIFLIVVMIAVFSDFFFFFVFCFVFPQGSKSFWKYCVICFVQQISCHACNVYLASFNSPSKCCFPLTLTFTFFSTLLDS